MKVSSVQGSIGWEGPAVLRLPGPLLKEQTAARTEAEVRLPNRALPKTMEVDLSRLDVATARKVDEILRGDHDLKVMKAIRRQTAIAKRNFQGERSRNGFGQRRFEVDAVFDSIWRTVYGADYSEDADVMKFLAKRNPEIAVKGGGTKIQIGYTAAGQGRKYSKKF